jgi:hypothetical protein
VLGDGEANAQNNRWILYLADGTRVMHNPQPGSNVPKWLLPSVLYGFAYPPGSSQWMEEKHIFHILDYRFVRPE